MRSILDKKKDKRGQVMIINLIFLVMTIVVFVALIPVLREMMQSARGQESLNCKSNLNHCNTTGASGTISDEDPCYNRSIASETVACTLIDLYIPYIVIVVLLAGVAKIMANRVEQLGFGQQAYPGY